MQYHTLHNWDWKWVKIYFPSTLQSTIRMTKSLKTVDQFNNSVYTLTNNLLMSIHFCLAIYIIIIYTAKQKRYKECFIRKFTEKQLLE